jgi:hypothetical protein
MTAKLDGTNGLIQQYDYQVLTTGFSYTFAAGTQTLIANPAGTLATGTITMPSAPADGMTINIESTQQITALTVQGNTGQSLVGGSMTLRANQPVSFVYRFANTTWYPFTGATNSDIISGVAQASTSGTSIDFTGIPSWVKRITVVFSNVSTSGTSYVQVQLGTGSTTYTTSGYDSRAFAWTGGSQGSNATSGILIDAANSASATASRIGSLQITNITGNTWVASGVVSPVSLNGSTNMLAGNIALSATLTAVRITTVNGTDTFDAGSVNILYE